MKTFHAKAKRFAGKVGLYIEIPFDCEVVFGSKGKIKVKCTINGQNLKTVLIPIHDNKHVINLTKGIRVKVNIHSDEDELNITLKKDDTPVHHFSHDLESELKKHSAASAFFHSLDPLHRRQFTHWVEAAKREETRNSRIAIAIEKLTDKERLK